MLSWRVSSTPVIGGQAKVRLSLVITRAYCPSRYR